MTLKRYYEEQSLSAILLLALLFRIVSILFSTGYGMHDDHFLVIEAAQSWVDGFDYNQWLPENSVTGQPTGHSFFYVGLHFLFFQACDLIGLNDPQFKMFFVRLFHGLLSMLTVLFGYKITLKISNKENAKIVGMLLAVLWFYPILSVRNMVEMVSVPFALISFWYLIQDKVAFKHYVIAGIFMGIAIAIRIQSYLLFGGIGLVLLFEKKWLGAIFFGIVSILTLFLTQITDLFLWGYPFAEMAQYIFYNTTHYEDYITQSWFQYFILLAGLLIPPVSLFLLFGYFRSWKRYLLLFLPSFIFLVFHSYYPNKQERFILPILPYIIILGVVGWRSFYSSSKFWEKRPRFYHGILKFFWALNILALVVISPSSTKKSRVDTMSFLRNLDDVHGLIIERTTDYGCYLMPRYYHGSWDINHLCYSKNEIAKYKDVDLKSVIVKKNINYCLLIEDENRAIRLAELKGMFPDIALVKSIEPSYMDKFLHFLNPRNKNERIYIYRLY